MILVVCIDDLKLGATAFRIAYGTHGWHRMHRRSTMREEAGGHVPLYWDAHQVLRKETIFGVTAPPLLDDDEDLIITAHGNKRQLGNRGSADPDYNLNADVLASKLHHLVLPRAYNGDIYLSACKSWHYGKLFTEVLRALRPPDYFVHVRVFGYKDSPDTTVDILDQDNYEQIQA